MWEIRSKSLPKVAYFLNFKRVKSVFLLSVFIFLCFFFLVLAHFDEAPFYLFGPHWIICVVAVFIRLTHSDKQRIVSQQTSSIIRHALASHSRIGTCQVWLEHTQLRLCEFSSGCSGFPPPSESIQVRFIHSGGAPKCTIFGLTLHLQPLLLMVILHLAAHGTNPQRPPSPLWPYTALTHLDSKDSYTLLLLVAVILWSLQMTQAQQWPAASTVSLTTGSRRRRENKLCPGLLPQVCGTESVLCSWRSSRGSGGGC